MGILALICLFLGLGALGYFIFKMVKVLKNHEIGQTVYKVEGKEKQLFLILTGAVGLLFCLAALFAAIHYNMPLKWWEYILLIFGTIITGGALTTATGSFMLYYYKLDLDANQKKFVKYAFPLGLVAVGLGLYLYTTGIADYLNYPLPNGISFTQGFITPWTDAGGFQVKFYGIVIVCGALLCYAITDHMTYKKYGKHGEIDSLFIVAFLFGILGARLWYCLVLDPEQFLPEFWTIFTEFARGGLAIQGGVILGITAGVIFMLLFRKHISLRFMMDVAIPTILLAQVMGRWGNFFNQEVYGGIVDDPSKLWFLPKIVKNNMLIYDAAAGTYDYRVPLFFIESTINLCGYFFIRYFLGKVCKFTLGLGYQASAYLVWYGMVRIILELLRNSNFKYMQSWYTAFAMFGGGLLLMLGFYLLHKFRVKKGLENNIGEKI